MVELSDIDVHFETLPIDTQLEMIKCYFTKNKRKKVNSDLVFIFLYSVFISISDDITNETLSETKINVINNIISYINTIYEGHTSEFITLLVEAGFDSNLFTNKIKRKYIDLMNESVKQSVKKEQFNEYIAKEYTNTKEYTSTKEFINKITKLYGDLLKEKNYVDIIEERIIKKLNNENINSINGSTFDDFKSLDVNFSEDFKSHIVCFLKKAKIINSSIMTINLFLINSAIEGLKIKLQDVNYLFLEAVKSNGIALQFIKDEYKTEQICLEAVKSNGMALQFIKDEHRTEQIYLEAVRSNGMALQFIKDEYKTEQVCLEAVKSNIMAFKYVKDEYLNEQICLEAIKTDSMSLQFINNDQIHEKLLDVAFQKGLDYNILLQNIYNNRTYDKNKKIKRIDQYFAKKVYYLLYQEHNLNSLINKDNVIKLDTIKEYYHSLILQTEQLQTDIFDSDKFIWFSQNFDQAFLHLFNQARQLSNIKSEDLIYLFIVKFKLLKEINILKSQTMYNHDIFKNIIPDKCLKGIMNALAKRHHYHILLFNNNSSIHEDQFYLSGEFAGEQNKFILIILNELNKFLTENNKIYGYLNELDQKEIALVGRSGLINLNSIKSSKYTRVIKKDGKQIFFPLTYKNYVVEFNNENITLYTTYSEYLTYLSSINNNTKQQMIECVKNRGIEQNSLRMFKTDKTRIFYQDFDDNTKEIEFINLNLEDYWKKKYLKYKEKYVTIKNKLSNR